MSRTPTPDELRAVYAELKRQGLSRYDYDELVRIDNQGRLLMTVDAANASKAACKAIQASFSRLAAFLIVALNDKTTGNNWLDFGLLSNKHEGPYTWAIYLEIDDNVEHANLYLDGYDAVVEYIPELDDILRVASMNGVDISRQNVHADIRGKQNVQLNEARIPEVPEEWYSKITALMIDDYWPSLYVSEYFAEVLNGTTSLNEMRDNLLSFIPEYEENKFKSRSKVDECDGGGAAAGGGDAGGAATGGGDAGGSIGGADAGDIGSGTTTVDVAGNCDHKCDGYFGPGCFHRPFLVGMPRRRIPYFISKKKKKKKKTEKIGPNRVEVIYDYDDLVSEKDKQ